MGYMNPVITLFFKLIFIYLACWVFTAAHSLSLVAESGDYPPVEVCGLLTAVASLDAEHRF